MMLCQFPAFSLRIFYFFCISILFESSTPDNFFRSFISIVELINCSCTIFLFCYLLQAFSQHALLSFQFLEHLVSVLNQTPVDKGDLEKGDSSSHFAEGQIEDDILQAAMLALTAFFRFIYSCICQTMLLFTVNLCKLLLKCRGGGKVGKRAVEQSYASVLAGLTLQFGSCHGLASSGQQEPLRSVSNRCLYIP